MPHTLHYSGCSPYGIIGVHSTLHHSKDTTTICLVFTSPHRLGAYITPPICIQESINQVNAEENIFFYPGVMSSVHAVVKRV